MVIIKKGDLIELSRRKIPGIGIVLDQIDDVASRLKIENPREVTAHARELGWRERGPYIQSITQTSGHSELLFKFFYYNSKWCRKYKNQFSYVRWFKRPSVFGTTELRGAGWYPTVWLKSVKKKVDEPS